MRPSDLIGKAAFWGGVGLVALFLLTPTLVAVPISFTTTPGIRFPPEGFTLKWYGEVFASRDWREATLNSFIVGLATAALSLVLGTAAALTLHRATFPGKTVLLGILLSPLVTPVIVLSVGMYMVFARWGLSGTHAGLIAAHTVLALPFVIVSVLASLRTVNPNLELASAGLGATPWFTFRRVTLPLILPGIVSGGIFAFITSWDEVVIAIFLTDVPTRTVPVMIWTQVRAMLDPATAAVGAILIAISAVGMIVTYKLRPLKQ
ncbi:MAG: ABC transporter permease [Rhodospirillaceae bacterium]|nr:ABC transporter permease [Rhodospirillaceae bacterium]